MADVLEQFLHKKESRAKEYHDIIEDMMSQYSAYHYAESTLLSILEYIEKSGTITEGQMKAIDNIKNNPSGN